ncbi:hypothetical protein E4U42_001011 [Claviceps africana]|uniref:Allergen Asp f 4 n=1 Tax=Claviceps africana TaxID=83212 RepID=A0A8K0J200_9HYPO|nr:hypothetical protein E4U42_001011 [Claviceps africana]
MKLSTTTLVLAAGLGVAARPSGHNHMQLHRSLEKRLDFVMNTKPEAQAAAAVNAKPEVQAAAAADDNTASSPAKNAVYQNPSPPSTSPAPSQPASGSSSGSGSGTGSGGLKKFCGGVSKRATLAQIAYKGNLGADSNYGCNVMIVDDPTGYDYSAVFENKSGKVQKCVAWLKIGPTGLINGFTKGNEVTHFDLPVGGKKSLVTEADTQGAVACSPDSIQYNKDGIASATWFEYDMANKENHGWSGADASCLVAADAGQPIQAMEVCVKGKLPCSTIYEGGAGNNAFVAGTKDANGYGYNIVPGPIQFLVSIG